MNPEELKKQPEDLMKDARSPGESSEEPVELMKVQTYGPWDITKSSHMYHFGCRGNCATRPAREPAFGSLPQILTKRDIDSFWKMSFNQM